MKQLLTKARRRELHTCLLLIVCSILLLIFSAWTWTLKNEVAFLRSKVIDAEQRAAAAEKFTHVLVSAGVRL